MKRFLIPLLAVLSFPTIVDANSYDEKIFEERWPVFVDNNDYGIIYEESDFEMSCSLYINANNELKNHFVIFQRYQPDRDLLKDRVRLNQKVKVCNNKGIY